MDLIKLQKLTDTFVDDIHIIVLGPNRYKNVVYGPIIEGAFRRAYLTLRTILFLSERPIYEHIVYANSCMDLSRKVFEDLITLEFMELKGKEKQARKLISFKAIERMRDLELLKRMGGEYSEDIINNVKENFEKIKNKFKDKESKDGVRQNPFGLGVEGMIDELLRNNKLNQSEYSTLGLIYTIGCRTNHFSPTDIGDHSSQVLLESATKGYIDMSLLITFTSLIKITIKYINEIENLDKTLTKKIMDTWEIMKSADDTNILEYQTKLLK